MNKELEAALAKTFEILNKVLDEMNDRLDSIDRSINEIKAKQVNRD